MARSVRGSGPKVQPQRRRSATAEVDHKLQNALRNVNKNDKKRLLHELKVRKKLEGVDEMEELEVGVQRVDEREEEEVDAPMSDPADAIAPITSALLDAAYSAENLILKQTSTDLKKVTKALDAAVNALDNNTIQTTCTTHVRDCKTLREELAEHVLHLQQANQDYQRLSRSVWHKIQETGKVQAKEVANVKAAFAALLSQQEEELQTYHASLQEIKKTARDLVRNSTDPKTIQLEVSTAIKACLQAGL